MTETPALDMTLSDWTAMLVHFLSLSIVAVGGAITTVPEMHRYLVTEERWLSDTQFSASISLAQAAPGPNILFVALLGWNIGLNSGSVVMGLLGVTLSMIGILVPGAALSYFVARWGHTHRDHPAVRAFKAGMAPVVIALLVSTGSTLAGAAEAGSPVSWTIFGIAVVTLCQFQVHILWLLASGALIGCVAWG
ncbi:MAG TPA: chromate transporter [Noviherbaspirillum sp.]|nr:chromate transporter [Noviherbaspirillum sp.]